MAPGSSSPGSFARFTRQNRLLTGADFDNVFKDCQRSADSLFTVLYRDNGLGYPRLGLAIAKKRVRRATERNRLKRLIRESFRQAIPAIPSADIVVLARDRAGAAANAMIFASLERHWRTLTEQTERTTTKIH
ncbi:MAG: ribonuclease P protein component [Gammaproteobacteria bacterium]|nr:ribonuclease P protein component [Gammaproteobacteria bacterium]